MNDTEMKHIVVIDDDPVIVKILEKKLNDQGCRVTVATDAPEGLQMVMNQKPDAVILDVMMPIINGYNICHLIKSEEDTKNI
ncbi:MAG: CheY-like chemotaxis protein, partial [Candidatus Omnitrophota bacterium]